MQKNLYELNIKKFRENYDSGDLSMLEYIKDYITPDLEKLYYEVLEYNEIYANGWTIQELFKMGNTDSYWKERADNFIKKHNVSQKDYDEYTKYFDDYCELRDKLLNELGLFRYIDNDLLVEKIPEHGFLEGEIITNPKDFQSGYSYTVARVGDFGRCVELHYNNGKATVEYGYKISHDYWENEIENADWFKENMSEEEITNKLCSLFDEHYESQLTEDEKIDKLCQKINNEFKKCELRNYSTLENYCKNNNIRIYDYLKRLGYRSYFEYKDDLRYLPRKELPINEILSKIPKTIKEYVDYPIDLIKEESQKKQSTCDSQNDLIYADNEVCYYDCHDGDYVFIDTQEALGFKDETENSYFKDQVLSVNSLSENLLQVDDNKSLYNELSIKYNLYDCIKNNCYISDDFKQDLEGNHEIKDYEILSNCIDYPILKENISEEKLKQLEKGLESFKYYQSIYDDGDIDIIGEYESKYGNNYLIEWYEGMMATDSFIEIANLEKEGELNNEL